MGPSIRKYKERRPLPNPNLPPKLGKLLVFGVSDENYLAFQLGKVHIYLDHCISIKTSKEEKAIPKIAVIRYKNNEDIKTFLGFSGPKAYRIFKSATYTGKAKTKAFFYNLAKNLLALAKGKVIRIKSKHPKLRKELYEIFFKINKEENFGCSFDFDEYDIELELRKYNAGKKTYMVVTSVGLD